MGQLTIRPTPEGTSLAGKTAIVTGGNAGLGYETARQFLELGASRIIIAARSRARGEEAASSLRALTLASNPDAIIECFDLDLGSFESVVSFALRIKSEVSELDILLLNGGINIMKYQRSTGGHERVMQVNVYFDTVLALEILPLLRSTAHSLEKKPLPATTGFMEFFNDEKDYAGLSRHSDSKMAVAALVQQLAAHVPASEVVINKLCPGVVLTGLGKNLPPYVRSLLAVHRRISARKLGEGARTFVYASTVAGPETHSRFLRHNKVDQPAAFLDQPEGKIFAEKPWAEMVEEASKLDSSFEKLEG